MLYTIHSKILGCPRQRGIDRSWKSIYRGISGSQDISYGCVLVKPYFLFFFSLLHEIHKNCMIFRLFSRHRKLATLISHFFSFNSHSEDSPTQSDHEEYGKVGQAQFHFAFASRDQFLPTVSCAYVARKSGDQFGPLHRFRSKPLDIGVAYLSDLNSSD